MISGESFIKKDRNLKFEMSKHYDVSGLTMNTYRNVIDMNRSILLLTIKHMR